MRELPLQFKIRKDKKVKYALENVIYTLLQLFAIFLFSFLVSNLIGGQGKVYGVSMEPLLSAGDRVIYWIPFYEPERGDVVICRTGKGIDYKLVKRIIGLPGDEINLEASSGTVYVNGEALEESYCQEGTHLPGDIDYPITVPPGQYFVMGDNRQESIDSRYSEVGTIEAGKIDGHVIFRFYPFNKMKQIE